MRRYLGLVLLVVGCTKTNNNIDCTDRPCPDPAYPYCDAEGAISGEPGTCIAVTCTPGELKACVGNEVMTCNSQGDGYDHVPCELGCNATPSAHCAYVEPRYLPEICDSPATSNLDVESSGMLDPNLDATCNGGVVTQTGAPSICVLHYGTVAIAPDITLKVLGTRDGNGRSIAFVADDSLRVDGILDISADKDRNGPGGGAVSSGGAWMVMNSTTHVAAGGAGGKTAGGAGGSSSADGGANNGGLELADPAVLSVFMGGAAAMKLSNGTLGGGGGGGALLISCHGTITVAGTIDAGGGGGGAGVCTPIFNGCLPTPAFAGGAGGYVVLQAVHVDVTGHMFANGGGGGGGMQASQQPGIDGADGSLSAMFGAAGGTAQNGEGRGGPGGVRLINPGIGGKPTTSPATAGGGGGSVGFFQVYTPLGIEPTLTTTDTSPAFQPNGMSKTR